MVSMSPQQESWQRACYLEPDSLPRMPQSIASLLPQVLARYCAAPEPVATSQVAEGRPNAERTQAAA